MFVRTDLDTAYQAVQATHAGIAAARRNLIHGEHPNLVVLGVPSTKALLDASVHLSHKGIRHEMFFEDDVDSYTAICTESVPKEQRKAFKEYKLLE